MLDICQAPALRVSAQINSKSERFIHTRLEVPVRIEFVLSKYLHTLNHIG